MLDQGAQAGRLGGADGVQLALGAAVLECAPRGAGGERLGRLLRPAAAGAAHLEPIALDAVKFKRLGHARLLPASRAARDSARGALRGAPLLRRGWAGPAGCPRPRAS